MKKTFKYTSGLALAGLLLLTLAPGAYAQRGFRGGGGGGIHITGRTGFAGFGGFSRGGFNLGVRSGVYVGHTLFYGYPTVGFRFGFMPFGYYPFYWGGDLYYYYGGAFYRPYDDGGYEVTTPPVGAAVPNLPKGAHSIVIDGQQYYEYNGVYFQPSVNDQGKTVYVVAGRDGVLNTNGDANNPPAPQVGDVINQLPDGCRKVRLNGKTYYVAPDGIYYEDFTGNGKEKAYRIVSIPSNDDGHDEHQM